MAFSQPYSYGPASLPVVVRIPPARRVNRLRFSWFVLGSLFGMILSYCFFSITHNAGAAREFKSSGVFRVMKTAMGRTELPAVTPPVQTAKAPAPAEEEKADEEKDAKVDAKIEVRQQIFPASYNFSVRRGDTLMSVLQHKGIPRDEASEIVQTMKKVYNPKRMTAGQSVEMHVDKKDAASTRPSVTGLSINVSPLKTIVLSRGDNHAFTAREVKAEVFQETARGGGVIRSSLYQTAADSGVPPQLIGEVINALSYDIDFQRDIREGDSIDILYERKHTGKNVTTGYGNVIYASLRLGSDEITIFRHASPDGFAGYYNAKGESVKKALLRTPINGAHITSSFGMRMHPLLGYSKMHKGVDFGAAVGTPIYAAGDGTVSFAGHKGGYGNFVMIKHNGKYATGYGHASRIAHGIHPGAHVRQGQVIAYVGSTGMSTGPHLHYEIIVAGAQVNPAKVKFRTGQQLGGREFAQFKREVGHVHQMLASLPRKTQVAAK